MFAGIEWETGIEEAFTDVATFVPKLFAFLAILIIGSIVAKIIRKVVARALTFIKADDIVEASGLPRMLGQSMSGVKIGAQAIYYIVMFTVLKIALSAFGENPISDLLDSLIAFLPKLIVATVIIVITGVIADKVGEMMRRTLEGRSEANLMTTVATVAIWIIGVFAALDQIQVAEDVVDTLFNTVIASLGAIIVLKFGIGGIWVARDRFWPAVYDRIAGPETDTPAPTAPPTTPPPTSQL